MASLKGERSDPDIETKLDESPIYNPALNENFNGNITPSRESSITRRSNIQSMSIKSAKITQDEPSNSSRSLPEYLSKSRSIRDIPVVIQMTREYVGGSVNDYYQNFFKLHNEKFKTAHNPSQFEENKKYFDKNMQEYKEIHWILLFVDLIYVAFVYRIDNLFKCGGSPFIYILAISYYLIGFSTRFQFDMYASLYVHLPGGKCYPIMQNDVFNRFFTTLYMLATFLSVLNVELVTSGSEDGYYENGIYDSCLVSSEISFGFAASILASRGLLVILYGTIHFFAADKVVREKNILLKKVICYIVGIIVLSITFIVPNQIIIIFPIFAALEVAGDCITQHPKGEVVNELNELLVNKHQHLIHKTSFTSQIHSPNDSYTQSVDDIMKEISDLRKKTEEEAHVFSDFENVTERLGLFVLLTLGEIMIGLLFQFFKPSHERYLYLSSAFFLVFSYSMQIFEAVVHSRDDKKHALFNDYWIVYVYLIPMLSFCLLVATTGLIELYVHISGETASEPIVSVKDAKQRISFGLAVSSALIMCIVNFHRRVYGYENQNIEIVHTERTETTENPMKESSQNKQSSLSIESTTRQHIQSAKVNIRRFVIRNGRFLYLLEAGLHVSVYYIPVACYVYLILHAVVAVIMNTFYLFRAFYKRRLRMNAPNVSRSNSLPLDASNH